MPAVWRRPPALSLVLLLVVLAGCGGSQTPLANLAGNQTGYFGKEVTTSGVVEEQKNANGTRYFVLADAEQNLVLLEPAAQVRHFRGDRVTVHGRFEFDPHQGRLIRVAAISRS